MKSKVNITSSLQLAYEEVGEGENILLLLSGAVGSSQTDFSEVLKYWEGSKLLKIIAIDARGCGESRPPNRSFYKNFYYEDCEDAACLMQKLQYKRYSVCGWSDGANVAAIMASKYPDIIENAVLYGGNSFMTENDVNIMRSIRSIKTWDQDSLKPMIDEYGEEYFTATWHQWVDHWCELILECDDKVIDLYTKELKTIQCQSLVLHGENDDLVPVSHAEYLNDKIENSMLQIWEASDHFLHMKFPQLFCQNVEDFILGNTILKKIDPFA